MSVTVTNQHETQYPTVDVVFRSVVVQIQSLLDGCDESVSAEMDFSVVDSSLRSLPLAMDDFALCRNRLNNAERYARTNEQGACHYELRQLIRAIERQQSRFSVIPRRLAVS